MSVKTVLEKIGEAPLEVLKFLATSKGQAVVAIGEELVETAAPMSTGIIDLLNKYGTEIIKAQALGATAAAGATTDTLKAAAVVNEVTPDVVSFAEQNGLATPTADEILKMNNLVVEFMSIFKPAATTTATTSSATASHPAIQKAPTSAAV
jgi:hypothetical protein